MYVDPPLLFVCLFVCFYFAFYFHNSISAFAFRIVLDAVVLQQTTNYMLSHQEEDSAGEIATKLIKVNVERRNTNWRICNKQQFLLCSFWKLMKSRIVCSGRRVQISWWWPLCAVHRSGDTEDETERAEQPWKVPGWATEPHNQSPKCTVFLSFYFCRQIKKIACWTSDGYSLHILGNPVILGI